MTNTLACPLPNGNPYEVSFMQHALAETPRRRVILPGTAISRASRAGDENRPLAIHIVST
jgi:hypothetical protein